MDDMNDLGSNKLKALDATNNSGLCDYYSKSVIL